MRCVDIPLSLSWFLLFEYRVWNAWIANIPSSHSHSHSHSHSRSVPLSSSFSSTTHSYTHTQTQTQTTYPSTPHLPSITHRLNNTNDNNTNTIPCPYHCGTILTGMHAVGNLTRHVKTQACRGSRRTKQEYACRMAGCGRVYARSDGLRVQLRRRHGAFFVGGRVSE